MLVWCLGWTNAASLCQFNLKHWMIWKKKCGGFAKTHAHTGCGWWPKRVLWVKDEKEHFALDSNVFVLIPGLPTVLCHDSCPPIQSNRRSIPTPQWLCFKSLHLTMLVWEKALQNWKDLCSHRVQILRLSYIHIRIQTHIMRWRWYIICQQTTSTGALDCFSALPKGKGHYFFSNDRC